jgi:hypothetical protein
MKPNQLLRLARTRVSIFTELARVCLVTGDEEHRTGEHHFESYNAPDTLDKHEVYEFLPVQ